MHIADIQEGRDVVATSSSNRSRAARRQLAGELRRRRTEALLTSEDVAQKLGCSESKISRIETARVAVAPGDFLALMKLYSVAEDELIGLSQLMERARTSAQPWWHPYRDVISANYEEFLSYEADADACWDYQPMFVPALLQTVGYARAVTQVGVASLGPDQVDSLVEVKIRRQERLHEEEPLLLHCLITQAALQFQVGGPDVFREQLKHLRELSVLPQVSLRVIAFSAGESGLLAGGFTAFGSGKGTTTADVCFADSAVASSFSHDPLTLRRVNRLYANLDMRSLPADDSRELIEYHEKELK